MPWAVAQASASQEADPLNTVTSPLTDTQMRGRSIGVWNTDCGLGPQPSSGQCTIAQQLTDKSVFFAWLIGNDGEGNSVAAWHPTDVLVNHGVVVDVGTDQPNAVPYTSCITGHCEAIASLAPDSVFAPETVTKATAAVLTVAGQSMTFALSVNGLARAIDAVKAPTVS